MELSPSVWRHWLLIGRPVIVWHANAKCFWLQTWLIANDGAMCNRCIVEKLCDWCGLHKAIGWSCHSHCVTQCITLRVTWSLQHQDKSDCCMPFLIESWFAYNFVTAVINSKIPKQHSDLWVLYWPQTFIWEDSIHILDGT
jgi:hypothetical protein